MTFKLFQSVVLILILFTNSIVANETVSKPTVFKYTDTRISEKDQKETLLLRDDMNAGRNLAIQSSKDTQAPETAYPPSACDPFPLPTEPIGPYIKIESE